MPFVTAAQRRFLDIDYTPTTNGELTYLIYKLLVRYLGDSPKYAEFSDCLGALESSKLQLWTDHMQPYEQAKKETNGDVTA